MCDVISLPLITPPHNSLQPPHSTLHPIHSTPGDPTFSPHITFLSSPTAHHHTPSYHPQTSQPSTQRPPSPPNTLHPTTHTASHSFLPSAHTLTSSLHILKHTLANFSAENITQHKANVQAHSLIPGSFPGLHTQLLSLAVRKAGEGLDGFIT